MLPLAYAVGSSVILGFLLNVSYTIAATPQSLDDLQELTSEPSRTELFELVKAAEINEFPALEKEAEKWFSVYGDFKFPNDAQFDVKENKPRIDSIFGVDISHHTDSSFPLEELYLKEVRYVYLKASQGTGFKDGKFANYWNRLEKVPVAQQVHRGAYHFLSAGIDGKAQAQTFLRVLAANGGLKNTDMPPVLDLEWDKAKSSGPDRWTGIAPKEILANTKAWLEEVEKQTGRKPMIYTARSWWRERMGPEAMFSELKDYPVWIADYSQSSRAFETPKTPANSKWSLWQFTDAAGMQLGYKAKFDANIFKGSEVQFYETFGLCPLRALPGIALCPKS